MDGNAGWRLIRRNLTHGWVTDNDPFSVNQFAHPYQVSLYHGAACLTGLSCWEASALTFAGSFLGEPLFRMTNLLLRGNNVPLFRRE